MGITHTALLIIDMQSGSFLEEKPIWKSDTLFNNINLLISMADSKRVPVFLTKHNGKKGSLTEKGTPGWEIHPSIPLTGKEIIIEKNHPDAFHQTCLEQQLAAKNIKRIIIAGIQSEICVDATCRRAFSIGYDVVLVQDGHSTKDSSIINAEHIIKHHNQVMKDWFASIMVTDDILFMF
ncbi:cysteine hydrolase family protein [Paenibacillus sp. Marseille-Q4541]|uniref:cysteine hydrolase family protein n=1 Tax=Paenibacillus sp. Marseille-Q4541 TaxID=2831522 RepID=UPI001BA565E7|nr:cysteine hydrolase family protein [Paenibacillus sp. Marseille-Q4541]